MPVKIHIRDEDDYLYIQEAMNQVQKYSELLEVEDFEGVKLVYHNLDEEPCFNAFKDM